MFTVLHFVPHLLSMELHSVTRTNFDIYIFIVYVHINHFQIHFVHCFVQFEQQVKKKQTTKHMNKTI